MTASTVVLYGHFGSGNIGNDSSFEAALHHIRKLAPQADLICVCNGPDEVARRFHINAIPIDVSERHGREGAEPGRGLISFVSRAARRVFDEINFWVKRPAWFSSVGIFIVVGTGAVDDMAIRRPWNAPYDLYKWCKCAKLGGARVVFLSVGVGPIVNRTSRFLMLKALRLADYRSYRETFALRYLDSVGFDTSGDSLYPDLVFSLPEEYTAPPAPTVTSTRTVGLGIINYFGWRHDPRTGLAVHEEYMSKIKSFVSWLLDKGYSIRFLVGDSTDRQPLHEIVAHAEKVCRSGTANRILVSEISTVNDLFQQIALSDYVVASRFHNVVCALMLLRPVVSLGYHEKNVALMTEMGLQDQCQHIEHFTLDKLIAQFEVCERESGRIKGQIQSRLVKFRRLLDRQYVDILTPLAGKT